MLSDLLLAAKLKRILAVLRVHGGIGDNLFIVNGVLLGWSDESDEAILMLTEAVAFHISVE